MSPFKALCHGKRPGILFTVYFSADELVSCIDVEPVVNIETKFLSFISPFSAIIQRAQELFKVLAHRNFEIDKQRSSTTCLCNKAAIAVHNSRVIVISSTITNCYGFTLINF